MAGATGNPADYPGHCPPHCPPAGFPRNARKPPREGGPGLFRETGAGAAPLLPIGPKNHLLDPIATRSDSRGKRER
jgi:hypothetical protein